jgi:hypothetical protein
MSHLDDWIPTLDGFLARQGADFPDILAAMVADRGPFRVALVVPQDRMDVLAAVRDIETLLRRYGLDARIELGVRNDDCILPVYDDTDVLVVLVLDPETQAFCHEFAANETRRRKLLACIPDDPAYGLLKRVLEAGPGIRPIPLPVAKLATGEANRAGIDIVRACTDRLRAAHAKRRNELRLKKTYVFVLHGIRTRAPWLSAVQKVLEEAGVVPVTTNYGRFPLLRFVTPFHWTKRDVVDRVRRDIVAMRQGNDDGYFVVLAHSFGSYIVGRLLVGGMNFQRVVLCGSIMRSDYRFADDRPDFLNDVGSRDFWPIAASKISGLYGSSGSFGFRRSGFVRDRFHPNLRHSDFLNEEFARQFWVPYLCDGRATTTGSTCHPSMAQKLIDDYCPRVSYVFLTVVASLALFAAWHYGFV